MISTRTVTRNRSNETRTASPTLACPEDHSILKVDGDCAVCDNCGGRYPRSNGIWRFIAQAQGGVDQFLEHYKTVRRFEGWGSVDPTYYRNLPRAAADDSHAEIWRVREANFQVLLGVLEPGRRVLDLGAGNGWLANRLVQAGHSVAALDLSDDGLDGLSAAKHYGTEFGLYQATFDGLPFADSQFDVLVFNASLHYSTNLARTLREGVRVLAPHGALIVMDSPIYHNPTSGMAMLSEKAHEFEELFGSTGPVNQLGFLTFHDFDSIAREFSIRWRWVEPFVSLGWATRHTRARWLGKREPARFGLMIGKRA